jgi:hypothetical protein
LHAAVGGSDQPTASDPGEIGLQGHCPEESAKHKEQVQHHREK